jgi:hypothetical protein
MGDIKYILSFDCADKTLGICLLGWIPKEYINERLECLKASNNLSEMANLINDMLFVKEHWHFNLIPNLVVRDTEDGIRLGRLKAAMLNVRKYLTLNNIKVSNIIVEHQMKQNDLSRLISAAIIYEFCDEDQNIIVNIGASYVKSSPDKNINTHIKVIQPCAKNSLHFHPTLSYGNIGIKYKSSKTTNKHHTAENYKYFIQLQNATDVYKKIKADHIKHGDINHISDAFMQAVYWILEQLS